MSRKVLLTASVVIALLASGSITLAQAASPKVTIYASSAEGSSNYGPNGDDYGPSQTTGAPDETGGCIDLPGAWATLNQDDVATLTVTYSRALIPTQIRIWANLDPRTVTKVETLSGATWSTVFSREVTDENVAGADCSTTPRLPLKIDTAAVVASGHSWSGKPVTQVRVTVDQSTLSNWAGEIDAVELQGVVGVAAKSTAIPTISGSAKVGSKLTASKGKYTGSPAPTASYQWYACSKNVPTARTTVASGCAKISGATESTFTLTSAQSGKFVSVAVTASNGVGNNIFSFLKSSSKVSKK